MGFAAASVAASGSCPRAGSAQGETRAALAPSRATRQRACRACRYRARPASLQRCEQRHGVSGFAAVSLAGATACADSVASPIPTIAASAIPGAPCRRVTRHAEAQHVGDAFARIVDDDHDCTPNANQRAAGRSHAETTRATSSRYRTGRRSGERRRPRRCARRPPASTRQAILGRARLAAEPGAASGIDVLRPRPRRRRRWRRGSNARSRCHARTDKARPTRSRRARHAFPSDDRPPGAARRSKLPDPSAAPATLRGVVETSIRTSQTPAMRACVEQRERAATSDASVQPVGDSAVTDAATSASSPSPAGSRGRQHAPTGSAAAFPSNARRVVAPSRPRATARPSPGCRPLPSGRATRRPVRRGARAARS